MIAFRRLSKWYGSHPAVRELSFVVGAGEVVAVVGPNGSGKTTSLKAAAGLLRPTSGEVLLGAEHLPAHLPASRRAISFLPQRVSFPDALTGAEVVEFYRRLRAGPAGRTGEVLRLAALNGAAGRMVSTYSGGMVQRLGLAVAALPEAEVLLLDEPTASLDAPGLHAMRGLIDAARQKGSAVLFTSHQLEDVRQLADRVVILVDGRLGAELTRPELEARLARNGRLRLDLDRCPPELLARCAPLAASPRWDGRALEVRGSPEQRARVVEEVRAAGLELRGLSSLEGGLESLYEELVGPP
ncbi:MAG TPA: ABC transporter ATP-binding protein [Myxococcaceae bacterium]|nr:ABC transporter ATP-binding protein [Myxococcaceae bacterium]